MAKHHDIGKKGELIAFSFLMQHKHQILETNWRYQKAEVDLISIDQGILVFTEVKTRSSAKFGNPYEFVSAKKQLLYQDSAEAFLSEKQLDLEIRFDIISILLLDQPKIEHFKNAF